MAVDRSPIISVRGVSKIFGEGARRTHALDNVSLDIEAGDFVSIIGPSGCGKSTLLRIVGDLVDPSGGSVTVKGKTPHQARLDREYGIVFQTPVLYEWRTVRRNVELPLDVMGVPRAEWQPRADAMLQMVGLKAFANHYPWQLSGGMQQRVAIARALVFNPSILLMDEPFGALDEMTRERLNTELMNIWSQTSATVLFITHSIPEAVFLSTRVMVMSPRPGRIDRIVPIDLPRPRTAHTRATARFFELVTRVREGLREDPAAGG